MTIFRADKMISEHKAFPGSETEGDAFISTEMQRCTHEFVHSLVFSCKNRQSQLRKATALLPTQVFAEQYCTLKINTGRGSGNTYTAASMALNFNDSLVITTNDALRNWFIREVDKIRKEFKFANNSRVTVQSINSFNASGIAGASYGMIIFDGFSPELEMKHKQMIQNIYTMFSHISSNQDICFLFMG